MANDGLGFGLDFLMNENSQDTQVKKTLRVTELEPNKNQPRKQFTNEAIQNLADSIREYGIIQPILVRPLGLNYQIVAGERRWRAARMLGLDEVPVIIQDLSDEETMAIALIENLQRENLNPLEEAMGYEQLMTQFKMSQEDVAKKMGKSRPAIANALRLLKLPDEMQEMVRDGQISAGHGRALLAIKDSKQRMEVAQKAAEGSLTVRDIEKIAAKQSDEKTVSVRNEDSFYKEAQLILESQLGRKVSVKFNKNKGTLNLEFYDKEDLQSLINKLV